MLSFPRCRRCDDIEMELEDYLRRGGAKALAFVRRASIKASQNWVLDEHAGTFKRLAEFEAATEPAPRRIVIAGGPRTGKSTLGQTLFRSMRIGSLRQSDALIATHGWSDASLEASTWMTEPGPWIVEGVRSGHALRKWLAANPTGTPCDEVLFLDHPWVENTPGQAAMAKGCRTVFEEIRPELELRGVRITIGRPPEVKDT